MTKVFVYFEATEGGMEQWQVHGARNLTGLYGWMSDASCIPDDKALVEFLDTAEVGDIYQHRLGTCVRLKDDV